MPRRRIALVEGPKQRVAVYYCPDWQEYQLVPSSNPTPEGTGHTDDKDDAIQTARHMAGLDPLTEGAQA